MSSSTFIAESDGWSREGPNILASECLTTIRQVLDAKGPVIVERWFYRGSRSPDRLVFDDYDALATYLTTKTRPGDAIHVWGYAALCRDDNRLAHGKCSDGHGRTPARGAY